MHNNTYMTTTLDDIWAEIHDKPAFIQAAEISRANDPGKMHLRPKINKPQRYEHSDMAYDDFDAQESAADWDELAKEIDDEISWIVDHDDEMSEMELSDGDISEISDTEENDEWVHSDGEYVPPSEPSSESSESDSESQICEKTDMCVSV